MSDTILALAANRVQGRGGRVVAFEPSPYAFQKLQSMVLANRLEHVTTVEMGLSDVIGSASLYLGVGSQNHTPTMVAHENSVPTEVRISTLDVEAERLGIDQIDFLKIDVEGYEPKVLAGARGLLKERRIRAIACEFNEGWLGQAGSSPEELMRLLREASFVEENHAKHAGLENRFFRLAEI